MLRQPSPRTPAQGAWEVLHEDPTLRMFALREVIGATWFDAPTAAQLRGLHRHAKLRSPKHAGGLWLYQIVVKGTPRFTDDVRQEVDRITRELAFTRGSTHIILAPGLAGAAARAFLSTALLVRQNSLPAKVFGELDPGAAWTARELGGAWTASELSGLGRAMIDGEARPAG